jgi:hypothetical protein
MHPLSRQPDHQRQTPIHRVRVAKAPARRKAKEELLFVNKKKQKNFFYCGPAALEPPAPAPQIKRSFLVLFFKKEPLACL